MQTAVGQASARIDNSQATLGAAGQGGIPSFIGEKRPIPQCTQGILDEIKFPALSVYPSLTKRTMPVNRVAGSAPRAENCTREVYLNLPSLSRLCRMRLRDSTPSAQRWRAAAGVGVRALRVSCDDGMIRSGNHVLLRAGDGADAVLRGKMACIPSQKRELAPVAGQEKRGG
ncbi:hypothetical protein CC78DRAFT_548929 [Lojkania enalia]|uniref:Uncharacterized protein n=1 Tax=Lojkania enalia TaxID=147567 RepID=A0A9P4K1X2_9PLEO|nr:hypothetical protein CC78DRAFT_548929 [Didymosphaeria enalia]